MNELTFLLHICLVLLFTLSAFRLGKAALGTWVCIQALLANLFVLKQILLFGFQVTCSDVFAIGSLFGLNLLQEHYGPKATQKTALHCFCFLLFFALLSQIHLSYKPSAEDTAHGAYQAILAPAPRLLIASLLTFFCSQKADIFLFYQLKAKLKSAPFIIRATISLLFVQLLDTVLFSFLGLFGLVASLFDVIVLSFFIKAVIICCLVPMTCLFRKWIHPEEIPT